MDRTYKPDKAMLFVTAGLGVFSFALLLAYHNIADGDLWARLAQGASIWMRGHLIHEDMFAFTKVLPYYIDHEWGSGLIFYSLLRIFGPQSLIVFKILTAIGAVMFAIATGRFFNTRLSVLCLLAIPAAATVFPGYVLVVRSHAITYLFFGMTLFCLEAMRRGWKWPSFLIVLIMIAWTNAHGGFVSGLGGIGIYTIAAFPEKKIFRTMLVTMLAAFSVTFINPYGAKLWYYLIPALTLKRIYISEWLPMPWRVSDAFVAFRIFFAMTVFTLFMGWKSVKWKKYIPELSILIITAYLALLHRRHAPFFGLAAAAFLGPYIEGALGGSVIARYNTFSKVIKPMTAVVIIYAGISFLTAWRVLPYVTFQVLAPVGAYPVREADILMRANAEGNLVNPLAWGNYLMWRLYPRIKISMCGRYEAIYLPSTRQLYHNFFYKTGDDWDKMLQEYQVDYIILDLRRARLTKEDLNDAGFELIWHRGNSALYAKTKHARLLKKIASQLPDKTIEPLDPDIPKKWW